MHILAGKWDTNFNTGKYLSCAVMLGVCVQQTLTVISL